MTGHELVRRLRDHARDQDIPFRVEPHRGKGSHQMIHLGSRRCAIPDLRKELRPGTFAHIVKLLELPRRWPEH